MADEQTLAPEAASDEDVTDHTEAPTEDEESEATESTEGQDDDQPASDEEEQVSPAKARRERRKAEVQRLKESEAQAQKELAETRAKLDRLQQIAQESQPPKQEDFANYDDYLAAKTAHSSLVALDDRQKRELEREAARQTKAIEDISEKEQQEMARNWADQTDDARRKYTDFDAVVTAPDLSITAPMARVIASSELGADIAYHLGTNKAEAARIAQMSDLEMARNMGAIEARLSMPKVRTQSTAPDPVTPVRPKATATKDPSKMTPKEYRAWRENGGSF